MHDLHGIPQRDSLVILTVRTAFVFLITCGLPAVAFAQTPGPIPTPAATATPGEDMHPETGGFDPSKLTPAQAEALRLAIIKTSQNPIGNIVAFPFENNFNYGYGPYTRLQYNLTVEPVFPIMLSQNWNLIARTIIPVLNQPSAAPPTVCASPGGCPSTFGLSDVQEQLFFAPKTKPGELIWGVGPIFQFPTATPSTLGAGKWAAGPTALALVMPGKWVMGALVSQLWSVAGPSTQPSVNSFLIQTFLTYNLRGGWALSSAPIITSNANLPGTKWTVPLGGGIAKTFKDGGQLMSVQVKYYTSVVRPLAAPQTNLQVWWTLLWPVKRGIDPNELLQLAK